MQSRPGRGKPARPIRGAVRGMVDGQGAKAVLCFLMLAFASPNDSATARETAAQATIRLYPFAQFRAAGFIQTGCNGERRIGLESRRLGMHSGLWRESQPSAIARRMAPAVSICDLSKTYASGFKALKAINLDIRRGEIFALLGPNGAGKTTLINVICGIVTPSAGSVSVAGHDIIADYRAARSMIGLVPQELHTDAFETVWATVTFSRGLFGRPRDPDHVAKVL